VSVVSCQVEVCASGRSLVQRSPTECGVSICGRDASTVMRPWPTRGKGGGGQKTSRKYVSEIRGEEGALGGDLFFYQHLVDRLVRRDAFHVQDSPSKVG